MKLKKQFADFYKEIKIDEEVEDLKEKREVLQGDIENKLPNELKKHGIDLKKSEIKIFDQGSYKLNTTISNDYGSIDRDVAVMFPLNIVENSDPRKIKAYVRDALKHQNRTLDIKEPCVNVSYIENGEEWMHIDLPVYAQYNGNVYLARGSEFAKEGNYRWEDADPEGLNEWLLGKITGNDQLRRNIRYIKKWKQEKYHDSSLDHEVPPSIGLTLLMCEHFVPSTSSEGDDDLLSLRMSIQNILNEFYSRDISKKVKSGKHIRALEGKFMGTTAPFGYRKDPQDKNHLIVDEATAPTVRLIYSLALEGYGTNRIGKVLYERKIPKPSYYKQEFFSQHDSGSEDYWYDWKQEVITRILRNA